MSADLKDGGPAFPLQEAMQVAADGECWLSKGQPGMSLRDWFAGQALAGLLAQGTEGTFSKAAGVTRAAVYAYEYADALLAAREKGRS